MVQKLVSSGVAARALGVDRATLARWRQGGMVIPALITAGGHARWDIDDLRRQLHEQRQRDE